MNRSAWIIIFDIQYTHKLNSRIVKLLELWLQQFLHNQVNCFSNKQNKNLAEEIPWNIWILNELLKWKKWVHHYKESISYFQELIQSQRFDRFAQDFNQSLY